MGKEFIVNSLEDMCDLMCGNIIPEEGIVHNCHCTQCGAEIEYRVPLVENTERGD